MAYFRKAWIRKRLKSIVGIISSLCTMYLRRKEDKEYEKGENEPNSLIFLKDSALKLVIRACWSFCR